MCAPRPSCGWCKAHHSSVHGLSPRDAALTLLPVHLLDAGSTDSASAFPTCADPTAVRPGAHVKQVITVYIRRAGWSGQAQRPSRGPLLLQFEGGLGGRGGRDEARACVLPGPTVSFNRSLGDLCHRGGG
ncbi:unnamed protein product [Phytomonas sp. Hart1]|nr:unnamed protein product [Phytomonas sp. Hart1]|eukprot:CCW65994.1 unnamed protein product [Phytomonas sp. isolate Hart1]